MSTTLGLSGFALSIFASALRNLLRPSALGTPPAIEIPAYSAASAYLEFNTTAPDFDVTMYGSKSFAADGIISKLYEIPKSIGLPKLSQTKSLCQTNFVAFKASAYSCDMSANWFVNCSLC